MLWSIIGMGAAFLTMFSFIPQILKAFNSKSCKDVSLFTLLQLSLGVALWISYGVYKRDAIIIIANSVTLSTLIVLLFLYFNYGRPR